VRDLDFLVGQTVREFRYAGSDLRPVFDLGDGAIPALYADIGHCVYVDASGVEHAVVPDAPATVGPILSTVGCQISGADMENYVLTLLFDDGSRLRCEPQDLVEAWEVTGRSPQQHVIGLPVLD
jgi:hypothetical protein